MEQFDVIQRGERGEHETQRWSTFDSFVIWGEECSL